MHRKFRFLQKSQDTRGISSSEAYFHGLRAVKGKKFFMAPETQSLTFEKVTMGIVWAPKLQTVEMMGFRTPAIPLLRASQELQTDADMKESYQEFVGFNRMTNGKKMFENLIDLILLGKAVSCICTTYVA